MPTLLLGVSSTEIVTINRGFGGTKEMNSTVDAVFQSTSYVASFWEKVAIVVRSIAGGHLFDNGNKRTAMEAVKLFRTRNKIVTGVNEAQMRETIRLVAIGQLTELHSIVRGLRGT